MRLGLIRGWSGSHPESPSGIYRRGVQIHLPRWEAAVYREGFGAMMEPGAFSVVFSFLIAVRFVSNVVVGRETSGDSGIAESWSSISAPDGRTAKQTSWLARTPFLG